MSLEGRRSTARWCSVRCRTYDVRRQRRLAAQIKRPRCMICDAPLPYGKSGFNLSATTCSQECHVKRNNWFVRKEAA